MKPIEPPDEYGHPVEFGKGQEEYKTLIARESVGVVTTLWQLTPAERQAIANGKNLFLEIITFGNSLQPVLLWVEGFEDE